MELSSEVRHDVGSDASVCDEPPRSAVRSVSETSRPGWENVAASGVLERVQPVVDAVLRRVVGTNDPEYEDLLQSSLENVLITIDGGRFRGDCPPSGLAATIARNVAVDALRARSRERRVFTRDESEDVVINKSPGGQVGPEHLAYVNQKLRQYAGALSRIAEGKADVVYLHDVLGYELSEVATMVGTTVAAAQSRLVRGRREVLDRMGPEAGEGEGRSRRTRPRAPDDV
jgi:RNA polymerase sigma-70 factor (ECF subfamily)